MEMTYARALNPGLAGSKGSVSGPVVIDDDYNIFQNLPPLL